MHRRHFIPSLGALLSFSRAGASGPREMSAELRLLALKSTPSSLGLDPTSFARTAWGTVIDISRTQGGTMSIACLAGGSTSIYFSEGGGLIGAGSNAAVAAAAGELLNDASNRLLAAPSNQTAELPPAGSVAFIGLFSSGRHRATEAESVLAGGKSPFSQTYRLAQQVFAAVQRAQPASRAR
jgi:hypothetical protein